jgi:AcrR family transcriptional regulator
MASTRISGGRLGPRKFPQQPRSQATVEAILQGAAQVFERHGYAAGTTNRIAQRAGVSIGTLYQYFPNKDAVLVALASEHLAEGTAKLRPHLRRLSDGASFDEVLPDVVQAMVELHALAPRLHRVLFEETPLPKAFRVELDTIEDHVVEVVAGALARDAHGSPVESRLRARLAISAIEGLAHRIVLRPPAEATPAQLAEEITRLVRRYLDGD